MASARSTPRTPATAAPRRAEGKELAVFRAREDPEFEEGTHAILLWRDPASSPSGKETFDPSSSEDFPQDMRVVEHRGIKWSADGERIFFGVRPRWRAPEATDGDARSATSGAEASSRTDTGSRKSAEPESVSDVKVWHSRDTRIIPMEEADEEDDLGRSFTSVWDVDSGRCLRRPYASDVMFSEEENQVDYHRRILEWFGHYLKGDEAPAWMKEGVSHLARKRKLDRASHR